MAQISNNLTKKQLQKLFKMLCVHKKEYQKDERFPSVWRTCKECILRDVPWAQGHCRRDLCFAIWHEGILND